MIRSRTDGFSDAQSCQIDGCGSFGGPGYPVASPEEMRTHLREDHKMDDSEIEEITSAWESIMLKRGLAPSQESEEAKPRPTKGRKRIRRVG